MDDFDRLNELALLSEIPAVETQPPVEFTLKKSELAGCINICPLFATNNRTPPVMRCCHSKAPFCGFLKFDEMDGAFPKDCPL